MDNIQQLQKEVEDKRYDLTKKEIRYYIERHKMELFSKCGSIPKEIVFKDGTLFCKSLERVVIGAHGVYAEFSKDNCVIPLVIPKEQEWRTEFGYNVCYIHFVPEGRDEKVYYQIKTVSYADYVPKKCYIDFYLLEFKEYK